jgi:hypothetical protein
MQQRIDRIPVAADEVPQVSTFARTGENAYAGGFTGMPWSAHRQSGILHRLMYALEPHALLRVEHFRLPWREPEQGSIEQIRIEQ